MDHKHRATLKIHMKMVNLLVREMTTCIDDALCASLPKTPAVLATAGWADGSISKSGNKQPKKKN